MGLTPFGGRGVRRLVRSESRWRVWCRVLDRVVTILWACVTGGCARCARGWTMSVMPDQKPPRSFGDDRQVLTLLLQYQRESLARKVSRVSEVAARRSPVPSGTTLLWLIEHLAHAERLW